MFPTHRQIANLINDQQAVRIDESLERLGKAGSVDALSSESITGRQPWVGGDLNTCLRGRIAQGDGDVGFARTAWPQQHHVLATLDEGKQLASSWICALGTPVAAI